MAGSSVLELRFFFSTSDAIAKNKGVRLSRTADETKAGFCGFDSANP